MTYNFFYAINKLTSTNEVELILWPIDSLCFQRRFFFLVFEVWLSIQNCIDPSHGGKESRSDQAFALERGDLIGQLIVQFLWLDSFVSSVVMSFNDARQLQSGHKQFFSRENIKCSLNSLSSEIHIILRIRCYDEGVWEGFCSVNKIKRQVRPENTNKNKRGHLSRRSLRTTCPDVLPKPIDVVLHGNKRILGIQSNQFRHSDWIRLSLHTWLLFSDVTHAQWCFSPPF